MTDIRMDSLVNDTVGEVADEYHEVATSAEKFAFLPRGIEYQKEGIDNLDEFLDWASEKFEKAQRNPREGIGDSDHPGRPANQILMFICMANALKSELKMWTQLKNEEWESAWNSLVDAQEWSSSAKSADPISRFCSVTKYKEKLESHERFLFPPHQYVSPGMVVNLYECSICGEEYNSCPHLEGMAYNGVFCNRVIRDIEITEVSFVDEPHDKKARVRGHYVDEGFRNQMTWEVEDRDSDDDEELVGETPDYIDDEEVEDYLRIEATVMTADGVEE